MPGKLFLVGDPKQSIYRFRGADISLYDDLLARALEAATHSLPVAIELVTPAGQVVRLRDVQRLVDLARAELRSVAATV